MKLNALSGVQVGFMLFFTVAFENCLFCVS